MNNMLTVILVFLKILIIALIAVLTAAAVLLLAKTGVEYKLNVNNFDISFEYKLIICGKKIKLKNKEKDKKKKKSGQKAESNKKKEKRKMTLSDIREIKESVFALLDVLLEIFKKYAFFEKFVTKFICALDNPAANGILYGGLQSVLNVIYSYFLANCNVKDSDLKIDCDFTSSQGLIAENCGKIYLRPLVVIFHILKILIVKKNIRRHIKNLKDFFNK